MKPVIVFRADGNLIAGYGHVIRDLSLASILKDKYHTVFIIQDPDDFLRSQIKNTCDEIIEIPATKNLVDESKKIVKHILKPDDIVILDGYGFGTNYQAEIKKHCFKLVCIDDICDRHFVADVIINHSEGIKRKNYLIEKFSKLYLGTQYAILRRSFLKKKSTPTLKPSKDQRAFINMGGTDQQNYTQRALQTCIKNSKTNKIDIVVGSFYPYKNKLEKIINTNKQVSIHIHSNLSETEICSLMKKSTISICSASTVSYEYACVGGILFVYQTVSNQKNIYSFLIRSKVAFPAKTFDRVLSQLENKASSKKYFENRKKYFSGNSDKNLVSIFNDLEKERGITIRLAAQNDVLTYFKWANDPEVRMNSVNTSPISLKDHTNWFYAKLKSKNSLLYIISKNGIPLGQVRFDKEKNSAEIDYSIAKGYRGKGYGEIVLKNAIKEYYNKFPKDTIIAKAKESNIASNRVFEKSGFKKARSIVINGKKYQSHLMKAN